MCGIGGVLRAAPWRREDAEPVAGSFLSGLRHRGPDDEGWVFLAEAPGCLVAARLAIQDPGPAGHQPMFDPVTGNCLVFNGEIYNFRDLRTQLDDGTPWISGTDTEVVLRAYRRWGRGCLSKFRGMFAIALWDASERKLLLARDPFGIKPLYWTSSGGSFAFASELGCLLRGGSRNSRIDEAALASFLRFGSVDTPRSLLRGFRQLEPGSFLEVREGKSGWVFEGGRTFELSLAVEEVEKRSRELPLKKTLRTLREALEESVALHLVSDVPVAVFLSGGVDSSAVVALASSRARERLRTFSVVFAERQFSEASAARKVAERFRTAHEEVLVREGEVLELLTEAFSAMDQPSIDGINTFVLSRAVRSRGIKVALSGLGGDELFGGYPSFRRARYLGLLRRVPFGGLSLSLPSCPPRVAKALEFLRARTPADVYVSSRRLFDEERLRRLFPAAADLPCSLPESALTGENSYRAVSMLELTHYMRNTLLRDADCMSMAHGLELRVPFVDSGVVTCALSLPEAAHENGESPKAALRAALGDLLPPFVWDRPKMGFTLPFARWLEGELASEVSGVLQEEERFQALGLEPLEVRRVWEDFRRRPNLVGWSRPWALYALGRWAETHLGT